MNQQNKLTQRELNDIAREEKIPYYYKYTKHDLMKLMEQVWNKTRILNLAQMFHRQNLTL